MYLVDFSDIFNFFFCLGRGKGESEAKGGGGSIFYCKSLGGSPGGRGAEGPGGCVDELGNFWRGGGGLIFFFRGRNVHEV